MNKSFDTIIFDLGAVLIDWNPRYLYRKIFKTEEEITWFLENICTSEWNDEQDAGRSFEEAPKNWSPNILSGKYRFVPGMAVGRNYSRGNPWHSRDFEIN